jgi:hypothetical protein
LGTEYWLLGTDELGLQVIAALFLLGLHFPTIEIVGYLTPSPITPFPINPTDGSTPSAPLPDSPLD